MGIAAALAVAMAVLISLTLTPALLGFIGMRVVAKKYAAAAKPSRSPMTPMTMPARPMTPMATPW